MKDWTLTEANGVYSLRHPREGGGAFTIEDQSARIAIAAMFLRDMLATQAGALQAVEWLPTAENVNALPQPIRDYIHGLATNCDPAGMVRENTMLRDTNAGLQKMYRAAADALDGHRRGACRSRIALRSTRSSAQCCGTRAGGVGARYAGTAHASIRGRRPDGVR